MKKKTLTNFLKVADEKHDINFHWPNTRGYSKETRTP